MTPSTQAAVEAMENARYVWLAGQRHPAQQYDPHADMKYALAALLAHLDATGWQIVPKVATEDMLMDGNFAASRVRLGGVCGQTVEAVFQRQCARERAAYTAMLAAAPKWGG